MPTNRSKAYKVLLGRSGEKLRFKLRKLKKKAISASLRPVALGEKAVTGLSVFALI
jgi:hypothetical protein